MILQFWNIGAPIVLNSINKALPYTVALAVAVYLWAHIQTVNSVLCMCSNVRTLTLTSLDIFKFL